MMTAPEAWGAVCIYESTNHIVVATASLARGMIYEIVDKSAAQLVVLHDGSADLFHKQRLKWEEVAPEDDEVQRTLEAWLSLSRMPLRLH